jgi:hypothetical protein
MHVLTGMLVASLLRGKGKLLRGKGKFSALAMLKTGPVQTAHLTNGRVRFRVPSLVDAPVQAQMLCEKLRPLDGINGVTACPTTGSVVISFDQRRVEPGLLFAAVMKLLGFDQQLNRTPRPAVVRELRSVMGCLDRAVYDRTNGLLDFSSAFWILLTAIGARKVIRQGVSAMPAGATLIWWGIHQLLGHGEE